jgi:hypothetical protein
LIISYSGFLNETGLKVQLVIAGKIDRFSQKLAAFAHGLRLDNKIIFVEKLKT